MVQPGFARKKTLALPRGRRHHIYDNRRNNPRQQIEELLTRIELVTSSLPRKCSTTELQQQNRSAKIKKLFHPTKKIRNFASIMPRILALDYGTKRTGVAVSDPTKTIAGALDTIPTHTIKEWLRKYIAQNNVDTIVIGLPTQMNGQPSETSHAADKLAQWAQKEFPEITMARCDERFTSKLAHQTMIDGGLKKMARRDKALVDRISATIILQSYLDTI